MEIMVFVLGLDIISQLFNEDKHQPFFYFVLLRISQENRIELILFPQRKNEYSSMELLIT